MPLFQTAIGGDLSELERHYATRIQRILEQVQETAEDVFGARAGDVLPDTGLRAPSAFSFKLRDADAIRDAIERAGADRRRGERHARARLERLGQIERRCVELAAELSAAEAASDHQARANVDAS